MKLTITIDDAEIEHWMTRLADLLNHAAPAPPLHNDVAPDKLLLTAEQAAKFLNMAVQTLAIWRTRGDGPVYLRVGRRIMYRKSDLIAWLNKREFPHTAAYPK